MKFHYFGILLLIVLATSQSRAQREDYIQKVMTEIIPGCDASRDVDCILHHLDSIYQWLERDGEWGQAMQFLVWKAHYAENYQQLGQYYQSLKHASRLLRAHPDEIGPYYDYLLQDNQVRWGNYYYKIADWPNAIATFQQLEKQLRALPDKRDEDWASLARVYRHLGPIHRNMGDFDAAYSYYQQALQCEAARGADETSSGYVALVYKHLGDLFSLKKEWQRAEQYYDKAIQTYLNTDTSNRRNINGLTTSLLGKAELQYNKGSYNSALQTLEQLRRIQPDASDLDYDIYQHFGDAYAGLQQYGDAENYYKKALDNRRGIFGNKHYKVAETYTAYGHLYESRQEWKRALSYYQQALISLSEHFDEKEFSRNPDVLKMDRVSMELAEVLEHKLDVLTKLNRQHPNGPYLELAWETAQTAIDALKRLKNGPLRAEQDKLFFWEERFSLFEKAIAIATELGEAYYPKAFEIAELSKGVVLLEAFKRANALHFAGVPDSLVELEKRIKYELAAAEEAAYRPQSSDRESASSSIVQYTAAREKYYGLLDYLETHYEDYYQLNYGKETVSVEETRRELISRGGALLEYFVGDSMLFAFVLDKQGLAVHKIPQDFPLSNWVDQFRQSIHQYHTMSSSERNDGLFQSSSKAYTYYAYQLYEKVFAPFAQGLPQDIVIIPDGPLAYLPFDALLSEPATAEPSRYSQHPYLLYKHQVSYAYSATLLKEMKKERAVSDSLLAFAPSFSEGRAINTAAIAIRGELAPLAYNVPEVESIVQIWGSGHRLIGADASKQAFLIDAPRQSILHIASHGILNDSLPSQSYIAFTPLAEEADSNRLYVRDLYGLKLHAAMVVLSACEAALGEWRRGEGIISLTRGFAYAGAKSLASTLWKVNESSTTEIMRAFYEELAHGLSKDAALRRAKMRYLEQHRGDFASHPYFWAAYVPIGDMEPLVNKGYWAWWIAGLLGISIAGVAGFRWLINREGW